jgi:hypothetical protein
VRAILSNYGWKICFLILLIIQNFCPTGTDWLLGEAGVFHECPGNPRIELQMNYFSHGLEDLVYCYCLLLEVQYSP